MDFQCKHFKPSRWWFLRMFFTVTRDNYSLLDSQGGRIFVLKGYPAPPASQVPPALDTQVSSEDH